MAEIILNKNIEFAYVLNSSLTEISSELEKRFKYQKIVIVDSKYEIAEETSNLSKNIKCDFIIVKNINEIKNTDSIACVIIVNCYNLNDIKHFCTLNNKPYIIALTKFFDTSILNSQTIAQDKCIVQYSKPLGVVLIKNKIYNKKDFICKFFLEVSNYMFDNMQSKIDNLFFSSCKNQASTSNNVLKNLSINMLLQPINESDFNKIAKSYLVLCINKSLKPLTLLDRLANLCCDYIFDKHEIIQYKFMLQYLLNYLLKDFFAIYTQKLKSVINIEKQAKYFKKHKLKYDFIINSLPEQKINFMLSEFRQKLIDYTIEQQILNTKIKNTIADIDVDFLYKIFNLKKQHMLVDFICIEPLYYNQNSILKILSYNGLLNF